MDREVFMAEPKTKLSDIPVSDFINAIPDAQIRQDCWTIVEIMQEATQAPPRMWGKAILGFGQYHAVHASGKGNDWMVIGFSPRKQAITLYLMLAGIEPSEEILARLGKYTRGKGCLYIKRLLDVDITTLKELVRASVAYVLKTHPVAGS
jgi:hypothetical protein